jgi:hypothetical protein
MALVDRSGGARHFQLRKSSLHAIWQERARLAFARQWGL